MKKVEVKVDVTDWAESALRLEETPQDKVELIDLVVEKGLSARDAAETMIALRELELVPDDILSGNKALLGTGGGLQINVMVAACKRRISLAGKEYEARDYVHKVNESDEEGDSEIEEALAGDGYVKTGSPEACENARRYLMKVVPGHVWNRLLEIAFAEGDVRGVGSAFIEKIEEMITKLENGSEEV